MSTDTTTITNPAETTTSNRRAEPPVNVYVRIRPFIGDELASRRKPKYVVYSR